MLYKLTLTSRRWLLTVPLALALSAPSFGAGGGNGGDRGGGDVLRCKVAGEKGGKTRWVLADLASLYQDDDFRILLDGLDRTGESELERTVVSIIRAADPARAIEIEADLGALSFIPYSRKKHGNLVDGVPSTGLRDHELVDLPDDNIVLPKFCSAKKQLAIQRTSSGQVYFDEPIREDLRVSERVLFRVHEAFIRRRALVPDGSTDTSGVRARVEGIAASESFSDFVRSWIGLGGRSAVPVKNAISALAAGDFELFSKQLAPTLRPYWKADSERYRALVQSIHDMGPTQLEVEKRTPVNGGSSAQTREDFSYVLKDTISAARSLRFICSCGTRVPDDQDLFFPVRSGSGQKEVTINIVGLFRRVATGCAISVIGGDPVGGAGGIPLSELGLSAAELAEAVPLPAPSQNRPDRVKHDSADSRLYILGGGQKSGYIGSIPSITWITLKELEAAGDWGLCNQDGAVMLCLPQSQRLLGLGTVRANLAHHYVRVPGLPPALQGPENGITAHVELMMGQSWVAFSLAGRDLLLASKRNVVARTKDGVRFIVSYTEARAEDARELRKRAEGTAVADLVFDDKKLSFTLSQAVNSELAVIWPTVSLSYYWEGAVWKAYNRLTLCGKDTTPEQCDNLARREDKVTAISAEILPDGRVRYTADLSGMKHLRKPGAQALISFTIQSRIKDYTLATDWAEALKGLSVKFPFPKRGESNK